MPETAPSSETVVALWRYPVKSMMGEELNAGVVTERGVLGDRAYALVDRSTGKVASAKNPRIWPNLFEFRAAFIDEPQTGAPLPPVRISLPDGALVRSDDPGIDATLSKAAGREVTLAAIAPEGATLEEYWPDIEGLAPQGHRDTVTDERMAGVAPPGTFFDLAPVHVLTTASMERLRELYPQGRFEVRRFRPNIVVRGEDAGGFIENGWVGKTLVAGDRVRLPVLLPVARCVMTTLAQGDLPRDAGILRTAAQHNRVDVGGQGKFPCVGVYAGVASGGVLRRGDPIRIE